MNWKQDYQISCVGRDQWEHRGYRQQRIALPLALACIGLLVCECVITAGVSQSASGSSDSNIGAPGAVASKDARAVVNTDGKLGLRERFAALQRMHGRKLDEEEVATLREYLLMAASVDGSENALRDVMLVRLEQECSGEEMMNLLETIHGDQSQQHLMRDYAIQHVSWAYAKSGKDGRARAVKLLRQALKETDTQIAGTALLAMQRIVLKTTPELQEAGAVTDEIERSKVEEVALHLAKDVKASAMTRISAIQVCANLGLASALPVAVDLAQNDSSIPLRIAAIAAIGDLGGVEQQALLLRLATGEERRLKTAAESALKRLQKTSARGQR